MKEVAILHPASLIYRPIGIIYSPHTALEQTPIQPVYAQGCLGRVEVLPDYAEGLKDLEGFSHIILIYHCHLAGPAQLTVQPFLQDVERGVFSTRAPCRPNTIGLSIVKLVRREGTYPAYRRGGHPRRNTAAGHQALCEQVRLHQEYDRRMA